MARPKNQLRNVLMKLQPIFNAKCWRIFWEFFLLCNCRPSLKMIVIILAIKLNTRTQRHKQILEQHSYAEIKHSDQQLQIMGLVLTNYSALVQDTIVMVIRPCCARIKPGCTKMDKFLIWRKIWAEKLSCYYYIM